MAEETPYRLFIIGGQEKTRRVSPAMQQLVMWIGELNTKGEILSYLNTNSVVY